MLDCITLNKHASSYCGLIGAYDLTNGYHGNGYGDVRRNGELVGEDVARCTLEGEPPGMAEWDHRME